MRRIPELESLRGLLALWVVLGHVLHTYPLEPGLAAWLRPVLANGYAVDVFIILSGFVIIHLLRAGQERYEVFLLRRFLRIFPAYAVCFALSVLLAGLAQEALRLLPFATPRNDARVDILEASLSQAWAHIWLHAGLLHGLVPRGVLPHAEYAFLGQGWSISVEWQFYLMAPALLWLALRRGWPGRVALAVFVLLLALVGRAWFGQGFVGNHGWLFAIGALSYAVHEKALAARLPPWLAMAGLWAVVAAMLAWRLSLALVVWAVMLGVILVLKDGRPLAGRVVGSGIGALLRRPALLYLGRVSYSVYLCHMIPLYLMLYALGGAGLGMGAHLALLMAGTVAGTLLLSHLLFLAVEQPGIAWGKRWGSRLGQGARPSDAATPGLAPRWPAA